MTGGGSRESNFVSVSLKNVTAAVLLHKRQSGFEGLYVNATGEGAEERFFSTPLVPAPRWPELILVMLLNY